MSTPRPRATLPDWKHGDELDIRGYKNLIPVTVIEKPGTTTTKIRTVDTGATMLVLNTLLRKRAT